MTPFQCFILAGSVGLLVIVLRAVYRGKLKEAYALLWIVATLTSGILAVFPSLLSCLADLMGFILPSNALFLCAVGAILLLLFQITFIISEHHERITRLMEEIALLKAELEKKK